jgi:DNA-binding NarL/FixJ family response regulator
MKIVIIDDHPLARKGIISILSDIANVTEFIECSNIAEFIQIIEKTTPELVILDLRLGEEDGLEAAIIGKQASSETKYIVITSNMSREDFIRAEKIGINGYILKDTMVEDILYIVDLVIRDKKYYDPGVIKYCRESMIDNDQIGQLTQREKEVLLQVGKGSSNNEIAKELFISVNTVKKHISSILTKLGFEHRTQVALFAKNIGF